MIKIQLRYAFARRVLSSNEILFAIHDCTSVRDPTDIYVPVRIPDAVVPDYRRDIKEAERM